MGVKHHRHVWYDRGLGISMSTPWYDGSSKQSGEGEAAVSLRVLSVYFCISYMVFCDVLFCMYCFNPCTNISDNGVDETMVKFTENYGFKVTYL